jgi:ribonuclease HI
MAEQAEVAAAAAPGVVNIYTDGSCVGNGKHVSFAGVGVFYGPDDPRNVSQVLTEGKPSNQNAELQALFIATGEADRMLREGEAERVVIHTDSQYGISCATTWYRTWTRNGWMTSAGHPVAHRGWIEPIALRLDLWRGRLQLEKIKAHVGLYGNEQADQLARSAAERARDEWRKQQREDMTGAGGQLNLERAPHAVIYVNPRTRPKAAPTRNDVIALGRTLVEVIEATPAEWNM